MTSSYLDRIRRGENPFVATSVNELDGRMDALYELKFALVVYTNYPPGPFRARSVFDLYMDRYAARVRRFVPTVPGSLPRDWTSGTIDEFRKHRIPSLRQGPIWGYGFDDDQPVDSYLFMFHGFRPVTQRGLASFFRFEFPWNVPQSEVRELAAGVARLVPFESGFAGYFFKPAFALSDSYDEMFAVCHRFWGIGAWNLEVAVQFVLDGFTDVNWLTLIGESLRSREPQAVESAKRKAMDHDQTTNGVVLQAADRPGFGDLNLREELPGYADVARALLPLQVTAFGSFRGTLWDEANSLTWLRRFTHPNEV